MIDKAVTSSKFKYWLHDLLCNCGQVIKRLFGYFLIHKLEMLTEYMRKIVTMKWCNSWHTVSFHNYYYWQFSFLFTVCRSCIIFITSIQSSWLQLLPVLAHPTCSPLGTWVTGSKISASYYVKLAWTQSPKCTLIFFSLELHLIWPVQASPKGPEHAPACTPL